MVQWLRLWTTVCHDFESQNFFFFRNYGFVLDKISERQILEFILNLCTVHIKMNIKPVKN